MKQLVLILAMLIGLSVSAQSGRKATIHDSKATTPAQTHNLKTKSTTTSDASKPSSVADSSGPYTILGKTYANKEDFDKVTALVRKKMEQGMIPPVVTDQELAELGVVPAQPRNNPVKQN